MSVSFRDIHRGLYVLCTAWACQCAHAPSWLVPHLLVTVARGWDQWRGKSFRPLLRKPLASPCCAVRSAVQGATGRPILTAQSFVSLMTRSRRDVTSGDEMTPQQELNSVIPDLRELPLERLAELGDSVLAHSITLYRQRLKETG